jgi:nucleoside diphosphate kinase
MKYDGSKLTFEEIMLLEEQDAQRQERDYEDSFDERIVKLKEYIRKELNINVSLDETEQLSQLREELLKIETISSKNGTVKSDYTKNYLKRYESLEEKAKELGVDISRPFRRPEDIKIDIVAILTSRGADALHIKSAMNDMLHKTKIKKLSRLPSNDKIDSKVKSLEDNYFNPSSWFE